MQNQQQTPSFHQDLKIQVKFVYQIKKKFIFDVSNCKKYREMILK